MECEKLDYSKLSPGIRDLVREIREVHGFDTCDSGDGTNLAEGMEGALPFRHVFIPFGADEHMARLSYKFLKATYPDYDVELLEDEGDGSGFFVGVFPDGTDWEDA